MLFAWFYWRFLRLALFISSLFTFLFLLFQFIKIDQLLFNLPFKDSLPFIFVLTFYHFCYFLPTSLFIAFSFVLFELKEDKKLHILSSFGINPIKIYSRTLIYSILPLATLLTSLFFIREEDIKSLRHILTVKYYTYILTSLPPGVFQSIEGYTLYVSEREGNRLKGIFFKFPEGAVVAQEAQVWQGGITFKKGSLLTQKEGKFYTLQFDNYNLSLGVSDAKGQAENKSFFVNAVNVLSVPLLFLAGYFIVQLVEHHHRLYYLVGLISVAYQVFLILLKGSL